MKGVRIKYGNVGENGAVDFQLTGLIPACMTHKYNWMKESYDHFEIVDNDEDY